MAKRNSDDAGSNDTRATSGASAGLRSSVVTVALVALVGGGYVTWHRSKDPARNWGQNVERKHAEKIEARLASCFGGSDAAAVRGIIPDVRRGTLTTPFRGCSHTRMTELIASMNDFSSDLTAPPVNAESAQTRERNKLERLRGSLIQLDRVTAMIPRAETIPEADRDRFITALEDVAVDVDAERTSMHDTVIAADSGASFW